MRNFDIKKGWESVLRAEFEKSYFESLIHFVRSEYKSSNVFPPTDLVFEAFNKCSFENLKVVILGQDPYHGKGQANGLCFSVNEGVRFPSSLRNIYKELSSDLGKSTPVTGDLGSWADQGCLLLNTTLTVREGEAGSHQGKGWEQFTDNVIKLISDQKDNVVFVLWGSYAQKKKVLIDSKKHAIVESVHPSPLSAYRGFFGSKPFSSVNKELGSFNTSAIDW